MTDSFGCQAAWLTLATNQFERLVRFYATWLEQTPDPYWSDRYAEFQLPGLRLGIFCPKADHRAEFAQSTQGSMSLCLEVADLEGAIAHLTAIGYPPTGTIQVASHGSEIYVYDPDGNRLILHQSP